MLKLLPSDQYVYLIGIAIIGLITPPLIKLLNWLFSPPIVSPQASKTTYECGEKPIGQAQVRYNFQFFTFAIVFVIFDVASVILLSFAFILKDTLKNGISDAFLSLFGATSLFVIFITIGLLFWRYKNALLWS